MYTPILIVLPIQRELSIKAAFSDAKTPYAAKREPNTAITGGKPERSGGFEFPCMALL